MEQCAYNAQSKIRVLTLEGPIHRRQEIVMLCIKTIDPEYRFNAKQIGFSVDCQLAEEFHVVVADITFFTRFDQLFKRILTNGFEQAIACLSIVRSCLHKDQRLIHHPSQQRKYMTLLQFSKAANL